VREVSERTSFISVGVSLRATSRYMLPFLSLCRQSPQSRQPSSFMGIRRPQLCGAGGAHTGARCTLHHGRPGGDPPHAEVLGLPAVRQVLQVRRVLVHRGRRRVLQRFRGDAQLLRPKQRAASAAGCEGAGWASECGSGIARTANLAVSAASIAVGSIVRVFYGKLIEGPRKRLQRAKNVTEGFRAQCSEHPAQEVALPH